MVVYKHTNNVNGKVYIGVTRKEPEKRWMEGFGYKQNQRFFDDIIKFGWDNFSHEILYEDENIEKCLELEKSYIKEFNSNNPEFGYNNSIGGDYYFRTKKSDTNIKLTNSKKEPDYIAIPLDSRIIIDSLRGIPIDVLIAFSKQVMPVKNENIPSQIILIKKIKERIADELGLKISMIDKYIKRMVDGGVFFRTECRSLFIVNPWIIAKGNIDEINILREKFNFENGTWVYTK
jgi:group I intron endonuclease